MGIGADKVDIIGLDVEAVDLEWPPGQKSKIENGNIVKN
jgi:hypothetical protein